MSFLISDETLRACQMEEVEVQTLRWLEVRTVSDRAMVEQLQNRAQLDLG